MVSRGCQCGNLMAPGICQFGEPVGQNDCRLAGLARLDYAQVHPIGGDVTFPDIHSGIGHERILTFRGRPTALSSRVVIATKPQRASPDQGPRPSVILGRGVHRHRDGGDDEGWLAGATCLRRAGG
ncbi:Uncharacterised protein [Mycobacteroides abscessus subsp. massiliense]|nr:Uncharacterised protein [Mycobacteroides abscessus subsp. massiliense]